MSALPIKIYIRTRPTTDFAGDNIKILDDTCEIYVTDSVFEWRGTVGQTISVLPIESGVYIENTEGLYYPCVGKALHHEDTLFMSNYLIQPDMRIKLHGGYVAFIIVK